MTTYRALILVLALAAGLPAWAQQSTTLQQRMSPEEFKAAGLDKLSAQELENLNNWLGGHPKTVTKVVDSSGAPVFYEKDSARKKIQAHLVGAFSGWSGQSQFRLDNGQVWKQAESGGRSCQAKQSPSVLIKPMLMGSWLMYVDGCSDGVRVRRVS